MPRLCSRPLPCPGPNGNKAFRNCVKNDCLRPGAVAEFAAAGRLNLAVAAEIEDPVRIENRDSELPLELLQQPEHTIDRTTRCFRTLIDADDQKAAVQEIARGNDRLPMRPPVVEKAINRSKETRALPLVQRWRDPEDPDSRLI